MGDSDVGQDISNQERLSLASGSPHVMAIGADHKGLEVEEFASAFSGMTSRESEKMQRSSLPCLWRCCRCCSPFEELEMKNSNKLKNFVSAAVIWSFKERDLCEKKIMEVAYIAGVNGAPRKKDSLGGPNLPTSKICNDLHALQHPDAWMGGDIGALKQCFTSNKDVPRTQVRVLHAAWKQDLHFVSATTDPPHVRARFASAKLNIDMVFAEKMWKEEVRPYLIESLQNIIANGLDGQGRLGGQASFSCDKPTGPDLGRKQQVCKSLTLLRQSAL